MELSTPAERRAFAIAKIKRSTSLPRINNGRRPRIHVSEGERSQLDIQDSDADGHQGDGHGDAKADDPKTEEEPIFSPATPSPPEGTSTKLRRRSPSRSRGRGSKDFKGKAKATQSPVPTNAVPSANESSPDEGPVSSTQPTGFTSPPLVSPIPAHFAARLMASQQLAGSEAYDPLIASPPITPPSLQGKVFRNNTVGGSGGERIVARKMMMRHINRRIKEAEAEQTSGDGNPQPAPHTRRKRTRKRSSTVDRGPPSATSPTTFVFPTASLPRSTPEPTRDESDTLAPDSPTESESEPSRRSLWSDAFDREISWIAEPDEWDREISWLAEPGEWDREISWIAEPSEFSAV